MGLFFWISGRMSAQTLARHSPVKFCVGKLIRLGIPTVVYTLAVHPVAGTLALSSWDLESVVGFLKQYYKGLSGVRGPVWYTATLMIFDIVAAGATSVIRSATWSEYSLLRSLDILGYLVMSGWAWMAVAGISFLVRTHLRVGDTIDLLNLQPAYAAQYMFAYTLGHLSFYKMQCRLSGPFNRSTSTLRAVEGAQHSTAGGAMSLLKALGLSLLTLTPNFIPLLLTGPSRRMEETREQIKGGWNLPASIYAIWNEFSFVTIGPALVAYFELVHSYPATSWLFQPRYSYAAFLVHPPASVAIEVLADKILSMAGMPRPATGMTVWQTVGPGIMTATMGIVNTCVSFLVGRWVVEYVPWIGKIV